MLWQKLAVILSFVEVVSLISYFYLQQKWKEVAQDCTKAVELNPKYVKALFRRAKAHEKLDNKKECLEGEYDEIRYH